VIPFSPARKALVLAVAVVGVGGVSLAIRRTARRAAAPAAARDLSVASDLRGRTVEGVRVVGNTQILTATILNVVRTREGDKFDPQTVQEDYQRVFGCAASPTSRPRSSRRRRA
jgi:outer membrane protein assembly factor BamA